MRRRAGPLDLKLEAKLPEGLSHAGLEKTEDQSPPGRILGLAGHAEARLSGGAGPSMAKIAIPPNGEKPSVHVGPFKAKERLPGVEGWLAPVQLIDVNAEQGFFSSRLAHELPRRGVHWMSAAQEHFLQPSWILPESLQVISSLKAFSPKKECKGQGKDRGSGESKGEAALGRAQGQRSFFVEAGVWVPVPSMRSTVLCAVGGGKLSESPEGQSTRTESTLPADPRPNRADSSH